MSEMIERVARAIEIAANEATESSEAGWREEYCTPDMARAAARAAIKAMRDPTKEMFRAIPPPYSAQGMVDQPASYWDAWHAMIDAALKD